MTKHHSFEFLYILKELQVYCQIYGFENYKLQNFFK